VQIVRVQLQCPDWAGRYQPCTTLSQSITYLQQSPGSFFIRNMGNATSTLYWMQSTGLDGLLFWWTVGSNTYGSLTVRRW
jgi:hypothetical protein